MKIRYFILVVNFFIISILTAFLYYIYSNQKDKMVSIVIDNIKQDLLESKYVATKYLNHQNKILNLRQLFDRKLAKNDLIKGFILAKNNKVLIISGDTHLKIPLPDSVKYNIYKLTLKDLLTKQAFLLPIELYNNGELEKYEIYIFLDKAKLNSLLYNLKIKYLLIYIFIIGVIFLVLNYLIQNYIITPLTRIKQFAQKKLKEPNRIFIKELNDIKNSLYLSFKKLDTTIENLYISSVTDSLTRIGNRNLLKQEVAKLIEKNDEKFCLLFIDLDNFKEINDFYGHSIGDELIIEVSQTLKNFIKDDEVLTRIGGDEFILVLKGCEDISEIEQRVSKLVSYLDQKWIIRNQEITTTASIGVVIYPYDGVTFDELLKNSDIAMYEAKNKGKNRFVIFDTDVKDRIDNEFILKNKLKKALENNEFEMYYQPKVNKLGKVIGCEALIRWNSSDGKVIPPAQFIPLAERSGLIYDIGNWVMKDVMKTVKSWENDPILKNIVLAFNVSVVQMRHESFFRDIQMFIDNTNVDISKLEIEITESVFIENKARALHLLNLLRYQGFKINLDDFGTGYSSLSILKTFDIDVLKIDKSFVDEVLIENGKIYVKTIVDMAKNLNIQTVAEGVENKEQFEVLKKLDVDYFQGYYFVKPLKKEDFERYVRNNYS